MNRFGLLLLLCVALGLASGAPADGRRVARRARVDMAQLELETELPAGRLAIPLALAGVPGAVARPAATPAVPCGREVREPAADLSSSVPGEPAALVARSRAPPVLG
jgi:hypothetical protein